MKSSRHKSAWEMNWMPPLTSNSMKKAADGIWNAPFQKTWPGDSLQGSVKRRFPQHETNNDSVIAYREALIERYQLYSILHSTPEKAVCILREDDPLTDENVIS